MIGKNCGFSKNSGSFTCAAFVKISTSSDLNPFFWAIPAAKGFITPTSIPIVLKHTARPAVTYVFPTSVSVPVINSEFNNNLVDFYEFIDNIQEITSPDPSKL